MRKSTKKSSARPGVPKPEIRTDYIHDRQVIIAPGRASRPHNFVSEKPPDGVGKDIFSPEALRDQPLVLTVGGRKNWKMCVKENIFPVVSKKFPRAYGYQEVVIETPKYGVELADLPVGHIATVLRTYARRVRAIQQDRRIRYILVFKNNGGSAGASINHAHSQIFASEYVPPHIVLRRERAQAYRVEHGRDYYNDLLKKEHGGPRWIADGKYVCALTPYASMYNYEAWIMPWRRVDNISQLNPREINGVAAFLKKILGRVNALGLPYNYYLHQVVADQNEHLYLRIAPRRDVWAGLELGSRLVVNTVPPEEAARYYRRAFRR